MKFCSDCGQPVVHRIPPGDNLPRYCCDHCGAIHYQNPRVITGTVPLMGDEILLCKRAIEPRQGLWTLPAGFLENGETLAEAALRETLEETGSEVLLDEIYTIFSIPQINQVYCFFRARVQGADYGPTPETLEVRLYRENEIPWEQLAFPVVTRTLKCYFADRPGREFPLHLEDITYQRK